MKKCPSDNLIERLAGGLPVGARVTRHASRCRRCDDRLRERRDDDAIMQRIRSVMSPSRHAGLEAAGIPGLPRIDGFRILRCVAEGGMGRVYEGEQVRPRRRVAIKLLSAGGTRSERRLRLFQREADALARVRHPDIAVVYSTGTTLTGEPYLAMEFVEGCTLAEHVRTCRPPLVDLLRLVARVARALDHAHRCGVVHRDLKPSNIMVDHAGSPRVLDFGLARITDADTDAAVTIDGRIAGTLAYMSPEQLSRKTGGVDARSDIYALGVILYELSTGSLPIPVAERGFAAIVDDIRAGVSRPPSSVRDTLSRDLDRIILRALNHDPAQRYQSAQELADDLERHLAGERVRAPRRRGHRRTLVALSAVLAVCAGMGMNALQQGHEPGLSTPVIPAHRPDASTPAPHVVDAAPQVHRLAPLLTIYGDLADAERTYRARLEASRAAGATSSNDVRFTLSALGMIVEAQGRHEEAIEHYRQLIDDVRNAPLWKLAGQLRIARCVSAGGDHHRAMRMLVEVLRQARRINNAQQPAVLTEVRVAMAMVLVAQGRPGDAREHLDAAAAAISRGSLHADWSRWSVARARAAMFEALGDAPQARQWSAEAERLERVRPGEE